MSLHLNISPDSNGVEIWLELDWSNIIHLGTFFVHRTVPAIAQTHYILWYDIFISTGWQHGACDRCIKSQFCVINMNKVIRRTQRIPFIQKKNRQHFAQLTRFIKVKRHTNLIPDSRNSNGFHDVCCWHQRVLFYSLETTETHREKCKYNHLPCWIVSEKWKLNKR